MNTLTRERIEQIREYALAGKVDTILVREQECVALCNHALSDLRRESAAPDGGVGEREAERIWAFCERVAREYCGDYGYQQEPMKLARIIYDAMPEVHALRSLERPAGRVVPEDTIAAGVKAVMGLLRTEEKRERPTIAELEKLLNQENPPNMDLGMNGALTISRPHTTNVRQLVEAVLLAAAPPSGERKEEE